MANISKLQIEGFRGIKNLNIANLRNVNLLVGNNNCGKTSLFEAVQLLKTPDNPSFLYSLAMLRNKGRRFFTGNSVYDSILCMFPQKSEDLRLGLSGVYNGQQFSYMLSGEQDRILVNALEIKQQEVLRRHVFRDIADEDETDIFSGNIVFSMGDVKLDTKISFNRLMRMTGTRMMPNRFKIEYLAPFGHVMEDVFRDIIRNESYKEVCIRALRLFDEDIEDILYIKGDSAYSFIEYVRHKRLGNMPLATYGDGIKRVLALANAVARAAGGILLVDEVETSIHKQYHEEIFGFICKVCKQLNVQLFVTTHSLEAVDGFLSTQNYDEQDGADDISVVTLKRENGDTYARVLTGREVYSGREKFGFEVRL